MNKFSDKIAETKKSRNCPGLFVGINSGLNALGDPMEEFVWCENCGMGAEVEREDNGHCSWSFEGHE